MKVLSAAILLMSMVRAAHAVDFSVGLSGGEKRLDTVWTPVAVHATGGWNVGVGNDRVRGVGGMIASTTRQYGYRLSTTEYWMGVRVLAPNGALRPYLEAGPLLANLRLKESGYLPYDDQAYGGWVGAGMIYEFDFLHFGANVRVSRARGETPIGGTHLGVIVGATFGRRERSESL